MDRSAEIAAKVAAFRASCKAMGVDIASGAVAPPVAARLIAQSPKTLKNWRSLHRGPPYFKQGRAVLYVLETLAGWQLEFSEPVTF